MAITRDASQIVVQGGANSRYLYGEQENYADESVGSDSGGRAAAIIASGGNKTGGDLYKFLPKIRSASIIVQGDPYSTESLDGFRANTEMQPPALNVEGGLTQLLTAEGTAPFFASLTQDKDPDETDVTGNAGTVTGTAVSLTAASGSVALTVAPVGVRLTFTPASATLSGSTGGITVTGQNAAGDPVREQLSWVGTAANTDTRTTKNFYSNGTITVVPRGFSAGTIMASVAGGGGTTVTFVPNDEEISRYQTAELSIGNVPHRIYGLLPTNASISATRGDTVEMAMNFIGRRALLYSSFSDTANTANVSNPTRTDLPSSIIEPPATSFVGWQLKASYAGFDIPITGFTINIEQNYTFTDAMANQQYQISAPVPGNKRATTLSLNVLYDKLNNWDEVFQNASTLENFIVEMTCNANGQYGQRVRFVARAAQVTSSPSGTASDFGPVSQTVEMTCVRPSNATSEYYFENTYQQYDRVRQF